MLIVTRGLYLDFTFCSFCLVTCISAEKYRGLLVTRVATVGRQQNKSIAPWHVPFTLRAFSEEAYEPIN